MKITAKALVITFLLLTLGIVLIQIWSNLRSKHQNLTVEINDFVVNVLYNKPKIANQKIFGEAVPYNMVWRTGMNEATVISLSKDCYINENYVKKGKYSLWSIPNKKKWLIILNDQTGQWGTDYNANKDYLKFEVVPSYVQTNTETMNISLQQLNDKIKFNLDWEKTNISFTISPKP